VEDLEVVHHRRYGYRTVSFSLSREDAKHRNQWKPGWDPGTHQTKQSVLLG